MPLVAIVLALASQLHAGFLALTSATAPTPTVSTSGPSERWVAPHVETPLWSGAGPQDGEVGVVYLWVPLRVMGAAKNGRLPIRDPSDDRQGWVRAADVGPVDPALAGSAHVPPIGQPIAWGGPALVTMYTCVELGGCGPTASGIWPEPGVVAVDPAVIPLGSTVWIQGLGTFIAADTGRLVRGAHLDVFGWSYQDAMAWGMQERTVLVFVPR